MSTSVSEFVFADPSAALLHFGQRLSFETDCADVHQSLASGADFVLLDVRGRNSFAKGHVRGAQNIPVRTINAERFAEFDANTLFVVYCAGPHCNGANKAALRIAQLGRKVKEMIGGVTGWIDEGFDLQRASEATNVSTAEG